MGILEELFKISTGMEQKMGDQSLNETSMDINYPSKSSTGMKSILGDQMNTPISKESLGGGGRSYDPNQQAISQNEFYQKKANDHKQRSQQISDYFKPEPFDPRKLGNDNRGYSINIPPEKVTSQDDMVPPPKPNAINELGKNPALFKNIFGLDFSTMQKNWKEKGGFEGLMANPAFMLGLGIIQSSAQGKSIGEDLLNNAVKAGAISAQYADRIKSRATVLGPITDAQREEVRAVLAESDLAETAGISAKIKNFFKGKNTEALNRRALDDIADRAAQKMRKDSEKYGGRMVRTRREYIEDAVKELAKQKKLDYTEKGFLRWLGGGGVQSTATPLAKGGPVEKGKDYIVGEEGPEMFVPQVDGNIINNDDSKVINMLLESNPQLKNVSRARAVKILKARFPDYF